MRDFEAFIAYITYPFWRKRYEKHVNELINKNLQVGEIMKQSGYLKSNELAAEQIKEFFNEN